MLRKVCGPATGQPHWRSRPYTYRDRSNHRIADGMLRDATHTAGVTDIDLWAVATDLTTAQGGDIAAWPVREGAAVTQPTAGKRPECLHLGFDGRLPCADIQIGECLLATIDLSTTDVATYFATFRQTSSDTDVFTFTTSWFTQKGFIIGTIADDLVVGDGNAGNYKLFLPSINDDNVTVSGMSDRSLAGIDQNTCLVNDEASLRAQSGGATAAVAGNFAGPAPVNIGSRNDGASRAIEGPMFEFSVVSREMTLPERHQVNMSMLFRARL